MKNQKYLFLYALIVTLIVFNLGIFMGYMLESSRINKVSEWAFESELDILNQRIEENALGVIDLKCEDLIRENIENADKIYEDALKIEDYEKASRINNKIKDLHKKYDLLRTLVWIESIKIKEKCNSSYHNIVYFYDYNDPTLEQEAKQRFFSKLLIGLKEKYNDGVLLIPIAADNNMSSINLLIKNYGLEDFPVILIDEEIKITDLNDMEDIEKYL